MGSPIHSFRDLEVWQRSFETAMGIFALSQKFPKQETYSLTDQIRRSSRSVSANLAEGWEKRRYEAAFVAKLTDAAAEIAETQNWLYFAHECGYITDEDRDRLFEIYDGILRTLRAMMRHSDRWCSPAK